jgi:hypothetical protein
MAMACFRLVTFLPLRPDFSFPFFISRISLSTFLPADGEYLRPEDFFELDFLEDDFFADELRVLFFALLPRVERLELLLRDEPLLREERDLDPARLELLLDFFLVAFLVAITILLGGQMASGLDEVACCKWVVACRRAFELKM